MPNSTSLRREITRQVVRSQNINLDDARATVDCAIIVPSAAIEIQACRLAYTSATTGTVAAGTIQVGTTVGGDNVVAAVNYENSKAVGYSKDLPLATAALTSTGRVVVPANTPLIARSTSVAATQAGEVIVEVEYFFQ